MSIETKEIKVRLTFTEEILGTASADPEIHERFIASQAPDAGTRAEEVEALGAEEVFERGMTVFPRTEDGTPFLWDYQIKGFCKDACAALKRVPGTESAKIRAHKKIIDQLVFVDERRVPLEFDGEMGVCQRPLRASTAQGERVALSSSETVPAGTTCEFTFRLMKPGKEPLEAALREWLDYGALRGIGQWRNSGKGRFTYEVLS